MLEAELTAVLVGMESAGKSTVFAKLTHYHTGEETNFRGSTVVCRRGSIHGTNIVLVDTPGIRQQADSRTTAMALDEVERGDVIVFVVRGTHAVSELNLLSRIVGHLENRVAVIFTFEDKTPFQIREAIERFCSVYGISFLSVNARTFAGNQLETAVASVRKAKRPSRPFHELLDLELSEIEPPATIFDLNRIGPWVSLLFIVLLFGLPVLAAYLLANVTQPYLDAFVLDPLRHAFQTAPGWLRALTVGDYGVLTLGPYSFLWAFPVVLLIGVTVAVTEESGLKDRIADSLDPWLQKIGLEGRDLIPVLTGFGCNVVGVLQSRACGQCTRTQCVSLIAFGSACSYTIGASLSLFSSAHHPLLFLPYISVVFLVGAIHTRIFNRSATPLAERRRTFLQQPTWKGIGFRVRSVVKQFLLQAMPTFVIICFVAALLDYFHVVNWVAHVTSPVFILFHLPSSVAPAVIFSTIRKDGMLVLNQTDVLDSLSISQLFVVVYLASTLSACMVTLWTIGREFSWRYALRMAGRQAATSVVSSLALAWTPLLLHSIV
ncbi:nucleoside recognition domain-containing protein [Alicyclobacillus acidiphilus]|uniref:nucleoside recognition domain-containing protein n=1 Tax=Alicyclobacillus acidiphilus TaxID=182455 RepID=UPI000836B91D|nr:nucleoside recognition domain-containing protein [Alicyclobacillus acidiphilus]